MFRLINWFIKTIITSATQDMTRMIPCTWKYDIECNNWICKHGYRLNEHRFARVEINFQLWNQINKEHKNWKIEKI